MKPAANSWGFCLKFIKENERELFERTRKLSNRAVDVFVRDVKMIEGNRDGKNENQKKSLKKNMARNARFQIARKWKPTLKDWRGGESIVGLKDYKASTIHHTSRFALNPTHDPRFLAPLCKEHHEIDRQFLKHTCNGF